MAKVFKRSAGKGPNSRPDKKFKHKDEKGFDKEKAPESKKTRVDKRENKPVFERFRDDSRPSDFGTSKNRNSSDKPAFKKRKDEGDERPSPSDRKNDKPKTPNSFRDNKKPFTDKPSFKKKWDTEKKPFSDRGNNTPRSFGKKSFSDKPAFVRKSDGAQTDELNESDFEYGTEKPRFTANSGKPYKKAALSKKKSGTSTPQRETDDGSTRLNKYLSNAGICSRREADDLIASGVVQVNGKTITEMGYRVKPTDIVKYGGQTLKKERLVYLILNKPKDYVTTMDDPQQRRTVLELVQDACRERIYPVGRLDRATTGLLMFTNDGDLTKKLTHPRYGVRKIYHVELDKPLKRVDLDKISEGIELEDGPIKVDEVTYVGDGADKTQVGVEIHSGKNRIVRRIFEHMGYNVRKLDRVMFGSLTKKDLPRGRWRLLSEAEVGMLKMISTDAAH